MQQKVAFFVKWAYIASCLKKFSKYAIIILLSKRGEGKMKVISLNRTASYNYFLLDTFEVGIQLTGFEVKSLRAGKVNLNDAFVKIKADELFLVNCHIAEYEKATNVVVNTRRDRKLLAHKSEITKLKNKTSQKGLTIVPTKIYFKGSFVKVEIALAKGKQLFDKKETIKQRDEKRDLDNYLKNKKFI